MDPESYQDNDILTSLAVVLPLALAGFVVAAGCWTLFAVAGVHVRETLNLSNVQFGLLLAMPMAAGALLAVPAGLLAQRFGARRVMVACLAGLAVCMVLIVLARSFTGYLLASAGLGLAAGFYSAGLQFVTRHSPSEHIGLVLGIFGAGVTGAGFNYYLVPLIHQAFAWQGVALAYLTVLLLVLALLLLLTDNADSDSDPAEATVSQLLMRLRTLRMWQLCLYFGVVAGSFFTLALWLPDYLSSRFLLTVESGAKLALWFVIPGALAQIAGGGLSDRLGTARVVVRALAVCLMVLFVLSYPPMTLFIQGVEQTLELRLAMPLYLERIFVLVLGIALGCAMGGLQRMMIAENHDGAAFAAGMLLVSACSVAFLLPLLFGGVNQWLGVRSAVFMILFLLFAGCLFLFARGQRRSERQALLHTGI
ncbi:MFS transporter [Marinobacter lipolyticus]|uniref:MFS transporter n=1 Tax=Marinobacter lipolyticus TaxID=209639 RepID=UPI003A8EEA1F